MAHMLRPTVIEYRFGLRPPLLRGNINQVFNDEPGIHKPDSPKQAPKKFLPISWETNKDFHDRPSKWGH